MYRSSPNHLGLPQSSRPASYSDRSASPSILDELDKIAPIKAFDAFPKVQSTYQTKSVRGGFITAAVIWAIFLLVLNDLGEYLYGQANYSFSVDQTIGKDLQLNVDLTVAMPCHYISIDLRDAVGDRVFLSGDFQKDGTTFDVARTSDFTSVSTAASASEIVSQSARRRSGLGSLFSFDKGDSKRKSAAAQYRKTRTVVPDGPACRIYGSVEVKKVTANLHLTTLGHGYMSYEHTDHSLMNLSHIIHEWSFGPYFPSISQPLDMSLVISNHPFSIFQYYLTVVPTTYIDASNRHVETSQYSVTSQVREVDHGRGVPGIFFKYDLEPVSLSIHERTTTFYQFAVRLVGVIGGVWTCTGFALRAISRFEREVKRAQKGKRRETAGVLGGRMQA